MIDSILWWHWVLFGCVLLAAEILAINSSFLIWFGIAALLMAVLTAFVSVALWLQLLLFSVFSLLMLALWFMVLRPIQRAKEQKAAKNELPGYSGVVIQYNKQNQTGTMRLQRPVCGKDVWEFKSGAPVKAGVNVTVDNLDDNGVVHLVNAGSDEVQTA